MSFVSSLDAPSEGVMLAQPSTRLFVDATSFGTGTLVLAASRLSWRSDASGSPTVSIEYKGISIHAVSRDVSKFPHHCLYLMVDGNVREDVQRFIPDRDEEADEDGAPMDADNDDDDDEDDDDDDPVTEIRFVPSNEGHLDQMFAVMSDCQALHPDSEEDNLSDDGDGEEEEEEEEEEAAEVLVPNGHGLEEEEEGEEGDGNGGGLAAAAECPTESEMTSQGLATLRRLEQMLGGGGGAAVGNANASTGDSSEAQFEDADDGMDS